MSGSEFQGANAMAKLVVLNFGFLVVCSDDKSLHFIFGKMLFTVIKTCTADQQKKIYLPEKKASAYFSGT